MDHEIARELAGKARISLGEAFDESKPAQSIRNALQAIIDREVLDAWLDLVDAAFWAGAGRAGVGQDVVGMISRTKRRDNGMFMTPPAFAEAMACVIDVDESSANLAVLDLSAGCGALLVAAIRENPQLQAVGVERNPALAIAAALALYETRVSVGGGGHDRVYVDDGLSIDGAWTRREGGYDVVIGNPPYVGEKGNIALFLDLRRAHPHLAEYFGPRIDLLYLFFHRGLDLLAAGGRLIYLTSEYWLTASGALKLRQDLAARARAELFVTFGSAAIFKDAPGHHSLLSVFRRVGDGAVEGSVKPAWALRIGEEVVSSLKVILEGFGRGLEDSAGVEQVHVGPELLRAQGWTPFVDSETVRWAQRLRAGGSLLGTLARDQQGFVSGADRVTRAHREKFGWDGEGMAVGDPIFMFNEEEIPAAFAGVKDRLFLPVLRGSALRANEVFYEPSGREYVLYLDSKLSDGDEELVSGHLKNYQVMLELRREVREGGMVWYRLHWPRRRKDFEGPKLVVARRAPGPCFSLDLSGSAISSDCTYLVAPADVRDPVRYLAGLMVVLNGADVRRYLEAFGKRKGAQLEFYAQPLRALPLGVRREGGELRVIDGLWEGGSQSALDRQVNALLERTAVGAI